MKKHGFVLTAALVSSGCVGTTGGDLFAFEGEARGSLEGDSPGEIRFVSGRGYEVTLTRARLHVGAVYLNKAVATSVGRDTSCTLPGIYVTELPSGVTVDLLSPEAVAFPAPGYTVSEEARTAEVWLMGGDVHDESDPTVILDVEGVAQKEGHLYPFEGKVTIGENRRITPSDPALPGSNPICKQRIVSPIPVEITPHKGGRLSLRVDPKGMFGNVEFSALELARADPPLYRFRDDGEDAPSRNLFLGLRSSVGVYTFEWLED